MKRVLPIVLVVALLAGCGGGAGTAAPVAASELTPMVSGTAGFSTSPMPTMKLSTSKPIANPVPSPSPTEDALSPVVEWILDAEKQDGSRLSDVAVTDGKTVYYRDDVYVEGIADDYEDDYTYTRIMQYDKKTKKSKELLNTKGMGFILQLYVDKNGILYYLLGESTCPDNPSSFLRVQNGQSIVLLNDVERIDYADDYCLYYYNMSNRKDSYGAVSYDYITYNFITGDKIITTDYNYDGNVPNSYYKIEYSTRGEGADIQIFDLISDTKTQYYIDDNLINAYYPFVYKGVLYAVDYNENKQQSIIYRINPQDKKAALVGTVDGEISSSTFYQGKWYFYSSRDDGEDNVVDEMIQVYDLPSGEISLFSVGVLRTDHLDGVILEAGCGYIWASTCGGGDGLYYGSVEKIKIP